jgi:hypothetical protein
MVELIKTIQDYLLKAQAGYLSMFPRRVTPCCGEHITEEDVWVVDGIRRDMDKDRETDMTVRETRDMNIVD